MSEIFGWATGTIPFKVDPLYQYIVATEPILGKAKIDIHNFDLHNMTYRELTLDQPIIPC